MKEQERPQQQPPDSGKEEHNEVMPVTSDSIKNAHAAGDGAMERSSDSIPDEEELDRDTKTGPKSSQQY